MRFNCQRQGCAYATDNKGNMKSHLGATTLNGHNMGPFVCRVPGCTKRNVRDDADNFHDNHPGIDPEMVKDAILAAALATELAATELPAPLAPHTAGPAPLTTGSPADSTTAGPAHSTTAESAPLVYSNTSSPYPPPGFHHWTNGSGDLLPYPDGIPSYPPSPTSLNAAGSGQSTAAPTAAGSSNTASSFTTTAPFAINPALLAMNGANHATPNNHNHGVNHGASTQGKKNNHNNNGEGPSSASAPLESSTSSILAHGEDSDTNNDSDDSESSREYLMRTGVAPLFMEAMKLLALTDPPVEKPLLWAGKWFEARSREIEGVDEEDEEEDVKDGGKEKEKEDENDIQNDDVKEHEDGKKDVEKEVEKDGEKEDRKDVEVEGEKDEKEDENK